MLIIKNWVERFENNRTRDVKTMSWMPFPTNPGGETQVMLLNHKDGVAHLACWLVLCQVAATSPVRGHIARENGGPHTPETLELVSRIPAKHFKDAIARLLSPQFGVLSHQGAGTPQEGAATPQEPAASPQDGATDAAEGCATDRQTERIRHTGHDTFSSASPTREPDVIWDTYIELFNNGNTTAIGNRGMFNKQVDDLKKLGATPDEMRRKLANLRATWPNATPTGAALVRHWNGDACQDKLTPPPGAELDAEIERCLEINRKALQDIDAKGQL